MPWYLWVLLAACWAAPLAALAFLFLHYWVEGDQPEVVVHIDGRDGRGGSGSSPYPHAEVEWQPGMMVQRSNPMRNGR